MIECLVGGSFGIDSPSSCVGLGSHLLGWDQTLFPLFTSDLKMIRKFPYHDDRVDFRFSLQNQVWVSVQDVWWYHITNTFTRHYTLLHVTTRQVGSWESLFPTLEFCCFKFLFYLFSYYCYSCYTWIKIYYCFWYITCNTNYMCYW